MSVICPAYREQPMRKRADLTDAIQERCIARMHELSLNPNRVAELVGDRISRAHVCDYLSRRSGMGTHKVQHLLAALGLEIGKTP